MQEILDTLTRSSARPAGPALTAGLLIGRWGVDLVRWASPDGSCEVGRDDDEDGVVVGHIDFTADGDVGGELSGEDVEGRWTLRDGALKLALEMPGPAEATWHRHLQRLDLALEDDAYPRAYGLKREG